MAFDWQKSDFVWLGCTATAFVLLSSCTGSSQKTTVRGGLFGDAAPVGAVGVGTAVAPAAELFDKVNADFFAQAIFKSPPHNQVPGVDFHAALANLTFMGMAAAPWSISACNDSVAKWAFSGDGNTVTITSEAMGASACKSVTVIACDEMEEKDKPGASSGVSETEQPTIFITKWVEACIARQLAGGIYHFGFKQKSVASSAAFLGGMPGMTVRLTEGHQGNACQVNISAANTFTYDGDCRYREAHLSGPGTKEADGWMEQNWARTVEYAGTSWLATSSLILPNAFQTNPKGPVKVRFAGTEAFEITFAAATDVLPTTADPAKKIKADWAAKDNAGHTCSGSASMIVLQ